VRTLVVIGAVLVAGCGGTTDRQNLLVEAFVNAAYEAVRAESASPPTPPQRCCGKCTNGKIRSGDGIAWVDCPCEKSCPCKRKAERQ
jgi:hypothetical protein